MNPIPIRLAVFDLAGTIVDHGCFGPVAAFQASFAEAGVSLNAAEVRGPMGLEKRDHIAALLAEPAIAQRFAQATGHAPSEADLDALYAAFQPRQMEAIAEHSELVPGVLELAAELARRGIAIATTTGYFREAAELVWAALADQGLTPAINLCPTDVPAARPAPWMIFRAMEATGVYPPAAVVKIGDTVPDIAEGLAAGAWSLGVSRTGSGVGLSATSLAALPVESQRSRMAAAASELQQAGAHDVLEDVTGLVEWLDAR